MNYYRRFSSPLLFQALLLGLAGASSAPPNPPEPARREDSLLDMGVDAFDVQPSMLVTTRDRREVTLPTAHLPPGSPEREHVRANPQKKRQRKAARAARRRQRKGS